MRSIVSPLIPGRVQVRLSLHRPEHACVFSVLLKWDYFILQCQTLTEVQWRSPAWWRLHGYWDETFTITVRAALSRWKILRWAARIFWHSSSACICKFSTISPPWPSDTELYYMSITWSIWRGTLAAALWAYESCGITGSQVWHHREKAVRIKVSTNPTYICGNSPSSSFLYGLTITRYLTFPFRNSIRKKLNTKKINK